MSYLQAGGERRFVAPLLQHFRGRRLATIRPEEIRQAARLLYPGAKAGTWNRNAITPARAIIRHAAELGWCQPVSVRAFAVERVARTTVDRAWLEAFMRQADADGLPHLAAALLFMHQTGARVSEVCRVEATHVDLAGRTVALARTKTGAWQIRHISEELAGRLAALTPAPGRPLFGYADRAGLRRRMLAVCRRAGIAYVPSHQAGRHSFATNALAMGADLRQVMDAGGWKSARLMLETYAHSDQAGRAVAALFDQAKPRRRLK
ncbi:MAG: tyrosine-type recombinase/integrase [Rhodospirillaceae bacterium]